MLGSRERGLDSEYEIHAENESEYEYRVSRPPIILVVLRLGIIRQRA